MRIMRIMREPIAGRLLLRWGGEFREFRYTTMDGKRAAGVLSNCDTHANEELENAASLLERETAEFYKALMLYRIYLYLLDKRQRVHCLAVNVRRFVPVVYFRVRSPRRARAVRSSVASRGGGDDGGGGGDDGPGQSDPAKPKRGYSYAYQNNHSFYSCPLRAVRIGQFVVPDYIALFVTGDYIGGFVMSDYLSASPVGAGPPLWAYPRIKQGTRSSGEIGVCPPNQKKVNPAKGIPLSLSL